jgi:RHS repeat-associated protein
VDAPLGGSRVLVLSYAQQRWYDPRIGRFLSEDPVFGDIQNPNSLQAFGYANGNPLAFTDASGTISQEIYIPPNASPEMAEACAKGRAACEAYGRKGMGTALRGVVTSAQQDLATASNKAGNAVTDAAGPGAGAAASTAITAAGGLALSPFVLVYKPDEVAKGVVSIPSRIRHGCAQAWNAQNGTERALGVAECEGAVSEAVLVLAPAGKGVGRIASAAKQAPARRAAEATLGDGLARMAGRARRQQPATVIGATRPSTGESTVGRSYPGEKGCCGEVDAASRLGGDPKEVVFTKPVRPRQGEIIPVCTNCQSVFDASQFPLGTPFDPGGPWSNGGQPSTWLGPLSVPSVVEQAKVPGRQEGEEEDRR